MSTAIAERDASVADAGAEVAIQSYLVTFIIRRFDPETDAGHHVGEREDDDIGVGRGERDGDRGGREQGTRCRGAHCGAVMVTALP